MWACMVAKFCEYIFSGSLPNHKNHEFFYPLPILPAISIGIGNGRGGGGAGAPSSLGRRTQNETCA